jgi:acyl carrier protein
MQVLPVLTFSFQRGIKPLMGLDAVEMVIEVEETFGIRIEDKEAEKTLTPGQLIELILSKITVADTPACMTQRAFSKVRSVLVKNFQIGRKQITPNTNLANLLPRNKRNEFVCQFVDELGPHVTFGLRRPHWLSLSIFFIIMLTAVVPVFLVLPTKLNPTFTLGLGSAVVFGLVAVFLTRPLRLEFPTDLQTVGLLSKWVVAHKCDLATPPHAGWTKDQVRLRVREIVVDTLGCKKEYREDARFVEDLGMS